MDNDLLQLRIVRIVSETADTRSYFLEPLNGQPVDYQAGQFLTLLLMHHGHEVRRSYSLSSVPGEPLQLTIKRVENGEISRYLHDTLRVGDVLTSLHPAGRFTLDTNQTGDLVLLGAGSGITPLFALLKQALNNESGRRVILLYSNSTERRIIFNEALADLQIKFPDRFRVIHLLSNPTENWTGLRGRLNNVMLERLLPTLIRDSNPETLRFYVCGPGDYMRMVQFTLVFSGFQVAQIRRENFVVDPVVVAPPPIVAQDRTVLLRFRGKEIEIQVPAYKSILQAALDEGVMLPYSCRGGRCSTCAARCLAGQIHMTINDVLTDHDLAHGWVLTCTGYPESDGVVIELG
ncbi:2Fe-2S iron-sulfur cluster-binding protein [Spirosoma panaciterrae]|uniref:2Fe-2S iron-sulfur cluster-binding protein n=1 Tax=Spirosoma panaciterrae TaxID=496058 RepID=UPI0003630F4E|nr:2Fe-2S iron-sulfur cluster-binding protein [Spirosoma panaciterrae]